MRSDKDVESSEMSNETWERDVCMGWSPNISNIRALPKSPAAQPPLVYDNCNFF